MKDAKIGQYKNNDRKNNVCHDDLVAATGVEPVTSRV